MSHPKSQISRIITHVPWARNSYRMFLPEASLTTRKCCKIVHQQVASLQNPAAFSPGSPALLLVNLSFLVLKIRLWLNLRSLCVAQYPVQLRQF